ncbi:MAG: SurA N-terminal domain-containing protein [Desulfobacterales bacterium]|nr:SurA N-terminal domain-containing protein [Desulfobacterales bacterium]
MPAVACLLLWLSLPLQGCQQQPAPRPLVLMKTGEQVITVDEYRRDLNIYRMATGAGAGDDPAAEHEIQLRFAQQLADQLVLLAHARALGIEITDRELDEELQALQRDYPDDVFEQLLLENAITLEEWRTTLRIRLTIERLIQKELETNSRISEDDVAQFMTGLQDSDPNTGAEAESDSAVPSDKAIVDQLRRTKMENAYDEWIAALKVKYPVEINQKVLKEILADSARGDESRTAEDRP